MRIAPVALAALTLTSGSVANATPPPDDETSLSDTVLINRPASPFEDSRTAASRVVPAWYGDQVHLDPYSGSLVRSGFAR
jgi:hypothetical protein